MAVRNHLLRVERFAFSLVAGATASAGLIFLFRISQGGQCGTHPTPHRADTCTSFLAPSIGTVQPAPDAGHASLLPAPVRPATFRGLHSAAYLALVRKSDETGKNSSGAPGKMGCRPSLPAWLRPGRWVQATPANSREHGQLLLPPLTLRCALLRSRSLRSQNCPPSLMAAILVRHSGGGLRSCFRATPCYPGGRPQGPTLHRRRVGEVAVTQSLSRWRDSPPNNSADPARGSSAWWL